MSVITRTEYGAIAVNKGAVEQMIIEDMLAMSDSVLLCSKKGKLIKDNPTPFIDPDYYDAVEVSEKKGEFSVKVYVLVKSGVNISHAAEAIFEAVEAGFDLFRLGKPEVIKVKVRGIISDEIVKSSIDIVRNNG